MARYFKTIKIKLAMFLLVNFTTSCKTWNFASGNKDTSLSKF